MKMAETWASTHRTACQLINPESEKHARVNSITSSPPHDWHEAGRCEHEPRSWAGRRAAAASCAQGRGWRRGARRGPGPPRAHRRRRGGAPGRRAQGLIGRGGAAAAAAEPSADAVDDPPRPWWWRCSGDAKRHCGGGGGCSPGFCTPPRREDRAGVSRPRRRENRLIDWRVVAAEKIGRFWASIRLMDGCDWRRCLSIIFLFF